MATVRSTDGVMTPTNHLFPLTAGRLAGEPLLSALADAVVSACLVFWIFRLLFAGAHVWQCVAGAGDDKPFLHILISVIILSSSTC